MRKPAIAPAPLLFTILFSLSTFAQQSATATISGRVVDPNGAVITGAQIIVTQTMTGTQRETVTNGEGVYVLSNLLPGEYELRAQSNGFNPYIYKQLTLRVGQNVTQDVSLEVGDVVIADDFSVPENQLNTTSAVVEGVISNREVETLPLNGRNFLELALLVPGNSPAPNFDPTKTNTVLISSAGQLGRGGNITIDGTDNNDDVVGGALQNISQEAVQEFQLATNRFSAQLGRSASSVINVVTKQGTNEFHGSASFFERDRRLQGLPATFDRSSGQEPPFDRQQYAGAFGGPIAKDKAWFFGAFEYRNQDGAVLVGERDTLSRRIRRSFAAAPLNDLLFTGRADWSPTDTDRLSFRYSFERADDVAASTLIRQIGSASQRQSSRNNYHTFLTNWTRVLSPTMVNSLTFSVNNFRNEIEPVAVSPQFTFPSLQDGASFRVPQGTKQNRLQLSDSFTLMTGNHTVTFGGDAQRIDADFDLGVFRQGRIEFVQDFPDFDHNGDGR
ncbi:MAG TPA: TonB-dependent receptor, partial [Pyrinomonadaceae bacterium]|nr:TonB-dependent receptor [Pyrinomonadaceae bacterium]